LDVIVDIDVKIDVQKICHKKSGMSKKTWVSSSGSQKSVMEDTNIVESVESAQG